IGSSPIFENLFAHHATETRGASSVSFAPRTGGTRVAYSQNKGLAMKKPGLMERAAQQAAAWAGSSWAFTTAVAIIVLWLISGPIFGFSDTWQLIINTGTTVVTFVMVFLLQRSQNKESLAIQLKLNEIVAAIEGASNLLINAEDLTEDEVVRLHQRY